MTMPFGSCPRCGVEIQATELWAEEYAVGTLGQTAGKVHGAQRTFWGHCPEHGKVVALRKMGHHTTLGEKEMNQRYPKQTRLRIRARLAKADRPIFDQAMTGKHRPSEEQLRYWDRLSIRPIPSPRSEWLGGFVAPGL